MIPHAVVFDLGKVLLDFDYRIAVGKLARHCAAPPEQLLALLDQSPLLHRYESGGLTTGQFFSELCAVTGFRGGLEQFREPFGDIFSPIAPMIELHAAIHRKGVPTYIFSNTNELAIGHIRRHYSFFQHFAGYVFSFEHAAMKPDGRLYEVVERLAGKRGSELLYLDDREENVATGRQRGWQVIHHRAPEETLAAIKQAGLL